MKTAVAPKATREPKSNLWVKTDPETHRLFGAACKLLGGTIQSHIERSMRETIERAGLKATHVPHASR